MSKFADDFLAFIMNGVDEARRKDAPALGALPPEQREPFHTTPAEVRRRFALLKRAIGGEGCILHPAIDEWCETYLADLAKGRTPLQAYNHVMRMACAPERPKLRLVK